MSLFLYLHQYHFPGLFPLLCPMRGILVPCCCFQTTMYLAWGGTPLLWGVSHLSNCLLLCCWLLATLSFSEILEAPNSYLHLYSNTFQRLSCPGVDDLIDINSLLFSDVADPCFPHLQWLDLPLLFSHKFLYSPHGLDIIQTVKSQESDSLLGSPPPGLPAHLLKYVLRHSPVIWIPPTP